MPIKLKKQLKELKNQLTLESDWKQSQRSLLLTRIKSQVGANPMEKENVAVRFLRINAQAFGKQFIAAGGVVAAVVLGVFASVSASSSLPGEFFYPMKITTERIQVTLVSDPLQKADMQLNFAKRRVDEIKKVATSSKDFNALKEPLNSYKQAIEDVKVAVANAKTSNPQQAADLAKTLHAATLDFTNTIKSDVADVANNKDVSDTVKDVIKTTKSAELDAVVLIAQTGDKTEAKQVIGDYLNTLKSDIATQAVDTAKAAETAKTADTAKTSDTTKTTDSAKTSETTKTTETAKTTETVKAPDASSATETAPASDAAPVLTTAEINKAQTSVDKGDIQAAIDIIKPADAPATETAAPAADSTNANVNAPAVTESTNTNVNSPAETTKP